MAADMVNRETVRDMLVSLLTTALVGSGKPVQAVYGCKVGDFEGQSPVVVVSSAGSGREKFQIKGRRSLLKFMISSLTLFKDPDSGWNEANAEDATDLIEKEIADFLVDNQKTDYWSDLRQDGDSNIRPVIIGGLEYQMETIPVVAEVIGGYS